MKTKIEASWEGVLPVWKPAGMTSHDVVARLRRILRMKRIGHTGTLDPQVTGVLPICLGRATRIVEYLQELPKTYHAELTIGYATSTEDATGEVTERVEQVEVSDAQVDEAIANFIGDIEQIPPMYSAVKSDGVRLYELARQGIEIERKPRTVTVYRIDREAVDRSGPYPKVRFTAECSKGTYIRTLCVDIGKALGYPAVMSELTRTASGNLTASDCLTLEDIARLDEERELASRIVPVEDALAHLPAFRLSEAAVAAAWNGRKIHLAALTPRPDADLPSIRVFAPDGRFAGLYRSDVAEGLAIPEKLFT